MRFTVVWIPDAQDQLAELWNNASNRNALTRAAYRVDLALANNPAIKGTDFYGDWLLLEPPLQVVYAILPDDMIVEVKMVW